MKRIALATSREYPNLTEDDKLLMPSLQALGIQAAPAIWDSKAVNWSDFDAVIIRSCWDYHKRLDEFLGWIAQIQSLPTQLYNSADLVRRNCNKTYLRDLEARSIRIAPTFWPRADDPVKLNRLLLELGWNKAVIKPTVSATAYRTWVTEVDSKVDQKKFEKELDDLGSLMIQEFMDEIVDHGEWSLMFFDKQFSHAVLKRSKAGDFRVQEEFGGETLSTEPPRHLVEQAAEILNSIRGVCVYARVDGVLKDNEFVLMELELVEPMLFLSEHPHAAQRFASAISSRIHG